MSAVLGPLAVVLHSQLVPQLLGCEAAAKKSLGRPSLVAVKQNHADERASGFVRKRLGHQHQAALVLAVATTAVRLRQNSVLQAAVEVPSTEENASEHALVGPCSVVECLERGVALALSVQGFPSGPDADPIELDLPF